MRAEKELVDEALWGATTDFPVRSARRAAFLIDGRLTMLEMCIRFLNAEKSILIAAWGMTPELLMVRGSHHRAGTDDSMEQQELLNWLRSKGLREEGIRFWQQCEEMSLQNILQYAVSRGVDVRVLLWDTLSWPLQRGPADIKAMLEEIGVTCVLDNSHLTLEHPIASLHQKMAVIDERIAFVGGLDVMYEGDGEHDRWDTKGHIYDNILRQGKSGKLSYGWHDMHITFEGSAVADVIVNFRQRWNEVVERRQLDASLFFQSVEQGVEASQLENADIPMQVIRTIPRKTYAFAGEDGIATILERYQQAFERATRLIYLENQYFWRRTYLGLETPLLSLPTEVMEQFFQSLAGALKRGVHVIMVLPDNPNVGRDFTDDGIKYLCELAPEAINDGLLHIYTLASSLAKDGQLFYRPIYVHAKIAIVDDEWLTIGSANLNNRGMRDDAELNVALMQPMLARVLRMLLMAEHLGLVSEETLFRVVEEMGRSDRHAGDEPSLPEEAIRIEWSNMQAELGDQLAAARFLEQQAEDNLVAIQERKVLMGHVVPYIVREPLAGQRDLAQEFTIKVDAVNGWLDRLNDGEILPDAAHLDKDGNENSVSFENSKLQQ